MNRTWWKESVVYQIYPRSFMDSNGDGIGDLEGIRSKLDYLKDLGVNVLWICPIYKSPNDDNGYDISDYYDILDEFGTMADFDRLLEEAHRRGIRVIMDLVINHTSDEHPWFTESRSSKDNPKRDYYIWRPGKNGAEPNNWESIFGGSAWQYDERTGEYYLHLFSTRQPDLNWENDEVRRELYKMIRWWLDKGIDGFRVDAITHIKKIDGLPDLPNPDNKRYVPSWDGHRNREGILDWLRELRDETFAKYDIMTVGEANGVELHQAEDFVGERNGVFNMIFQFEHMSVDHGPGGKWDYNPNWKLTDLKRILSKWQEGLEGKGWNALFLENHDAPRSVSRFGNDSEKFRSVSAKMLATCYMLMKGTPYIYQGQELGMTNVRFETIEDYRDVEIMNLYREGRAEGKSEREILRAVYSQGRDNSRTPMQWTAEANAGFTTGTPWIKVNPNYPEINVQRQLQDSDSVLNYYKRLIAFRQSHDTAIYGNYELLLPDDEQLYAYARRLGDEALIVICSFSEREATASLPEPWAGCEAELVLGNYPAPEHLGPSPLPDLIALKPYEARVYRIGKAEAQ
ncbi:alpha-glucosidase [Paenibacillus thermoaerophilus]|uniref:Alpha-glucosidase n=1 Tax=Paenibacillus thermoaerophilus TaxID=1215385 RepID=A0ABW2UYP7_9BACL|nr:alpha-glucosidase [Paenibacillus thermoaerophilus]TMV10416.1 alpha-glucosidase [Paenibacillus thermoaerophilus]